MKQELSVIRKEGFSLVEAVIAVSIFSIFIVIAATNFTLPNKSISSAGQEARAAHFAEEGLEAARNIRDSNFSNLTDGSHGLATNGIAWSFSGNQDNPDIFTRKIKISSIDANTKELESEISWTDKGKSKKVSLKERLTNWRAVAGWVQPSSGPCANASGGQNGTKVQISGNYAYVVTQSASQSLIAVDIYNPKNVVTKSTFSFQSNPNNLAISGHYAYITSAHNSEELEVIDISDPAAMVQVGAYNASGNGKANGIDISETTAYVVRSSQGNKDEFLAVDISNPVSPSLRGSMRLNSAGNEVVKMGNYAYVATDDQNGELKVIDVTNSESPSLKGTYNITGNVVLLTIAGFGNTVLAGGSNGILYIFDVSNPAAPVLRGQFAAGGSVNDVAIGNSNTLAFLTTSNATKEFQVVNITDTSNPSLVSGINMNGNLNGVAYRSDGDFVIAVGSSNTEEYCVISSR